MTPTATIQELLQATLQRLTAGRLDEAEALADRLIRQAPGDANGHYFKGAARLLRGDAAGAVAPLAAAAKRAPGAALIETARGRAFLLLERFEEARAAFERAVKSEPAAGEAWYKLGETLRAMERTDEARAAFERAAGSPTHDVAARCALAELAAAAGDVDAALAWVSPVDDGRDPQARLVHARTLARAGRVEEAARLLEPALADPSWSPTNQAVGWGLLGEARHTLKDHPSAFAAFARANAVLRQTHAATRFPPGLDLTLTELLALKDAVAAIDAGAWPERAPASQTAPVFLVGFPRSGTTLLDQILASHSNVDVIEERAILAEGFAALDQTPSPDPRGVLSLTEKRLGAFRTRYRRALESQLDRPYPPIRIDKYPLLLVWAPVIRAVWPDAKFILALRDPRDAVFSAFQKRFGMNAAMYEMLTLDTAARYYDAAMGLFQDFAARVDCHVHAVRYEDVIASFDETIASLLAFLDAPWEDAVRDYRATAAARQVNTPSAEQVVKPLYASSIAKWRAYETELTPARALLDPWAARFGYDV